MNLYEINEAIEAGFVFDEETGEIIEVNIDALKMERENKLENIALWIKNLTAEEEALKREKATFEARRKATENKAKSLKSYLIGALNGQKFKTTKVQVTKRKTISVNITNELALPEIYVRRETIIDKRAIKQALDNGEDIAGAELVEGLSWSVR